MGIYVLEDFVYRKLVLGVCGRRVSTQLWLKAITGFVLHWFLSLLRGPHEVLEIQPAFFFLHYYLWPQKLPLTWFCGDCIHHIIHYDLSNFIKQLCSREKMCRGVKLPSMEIKKSVQKSDNKLSHKWRKLITQCWNTVH